LTNEIRSQLVACCASNVAPHYGTE